MCGFAGIIRPQHTLGLDAFKEILHNMGSSIVNRGPDDAGIWLDEKNGVGLSHRRLAVLDLSSAGRQPMLSASERYCIVYNGEVYNFKEIKKVLGGIRSHNWTGHSDTEVILAAIEEWGVPQTLKKLVGMFAFALWDRREKILYLVRDRMGEKPLYYGVNNDTFFFGSDLKSFRETPWWRPEVDHHSLGLFFKFGYISAPYSIYKGIKKLIPGTYLKLAVQGKKITENELHKPTPYWSFPKSQTVSSQVFSGNIQEAVNNLEELLIQSINLQKIADVPLGTFLSGGIDSSLVTALLQANSTRPVKTFSIGFKEKSYNEADHAQTVAGHLGTDHTERYLSAEDIISIIPELPDIYSEPFADVSQLPTTMVARLAREKVTVCLSGDGGDELFCGYGRYQKDPARWKQINRLPMVVRKAISQLIQKTPHRALDSLLTWGRLVRANDMHQGSLASSVKRLGDELVFRSFEQLYDFRLSHVRQPESMVPGYFAPPMNIPDHGINPYQYMMLYDTLSYLPDDILVKVDRAAMSTSLESRIPLLDHRVVEFASSLPVSIKVHNGQFKWPLKEILYKYVPQQIVDRPKMGFGVPMGNWLRGPLREWGEDLLDEGKLQEQDYLSPEFVRQLWKEHLAGDFNHQAPLWDVLMFQSWRERYKL